MKVLCPIDFSEASINACEWVIQLMKNSGGGKLELTHFVYVKRRASIFMSVERIFMERAENDMKSLMENLRGLADNVTLDFSIFAAHPKEGIVSIAEDKDCDLIVTGTTGLTAIKDVTIGSVTEFIFNHSSIPVLAIPENITFEKCNRIAVAVDDELLRQMSGITFLRDLCMKLDASLHVVHVTKKDESPFEYDPAIDMIFKKIDFSYERLTLKDSMASTISGYCVEKKIDLLAMIHHKRNLIKKLFTKSTTKSKLYKLETPLLVLNDF